MIEANIETDIEQLERKVISYSKFTKKTLPEVINKKLFDTGLRATSTTKAATRQQIRADRLKGSKIAPNAPIQAILINKKRGKGNGLNGAKMAVAVEKAIRLAERSANFIRAGWKKSANDMRPYVKSTAGSPRAESFPMRNGGVGLGKAIPAIESDAYIATGEIINKVKGPEKVAHIKEVGKAAAIQVVVADMDIYLERKMTEAKEAAGFN